MKKLVEKLSKTAMTNLERDGFLTPVALLIRGKHILMPIIIHYETDEDKYKNYYLVGKVAKSYSADAIILVNDAAMRGFEKLEDFQYAKKNYASESPLTYPESMRKEVIVILVIDLVSKEITGYFQQYAKEGTKFSFRRMKNFKVNPSGLSSYIMEGYNSVEKVV